MLPWDEGKMGLGIFPAFERRENERKYSETWDEREKKVSTQI